MTAEWSAIEIAAIIIECLAMVYFANSRFPAKRGNSRLLAALTFIFCVVVDAVFTFAALPMLEGALFAVLLAFLLAAKKGNAVNKIFCALFAMAIAIGTALVGAQLAAAASSAPFQGIFRNQESVRIVAIALSKAFQMIVFWLFSKRRALLKLALRMPSIILSIAALLNLACLFLLYLLCLTLEISRRGGVIITVITIGILSTTALVFLLFDIFAREENSQLELLSQMQRLEIEGNFHRQIDAMYADMRRWRHDYKNHTLSLAAMLENGEEDKALEYLRQMSKEPCRVEETLNIPNMALNAIVSTKLTYARSKDIDITLSVAYPEHVPINDTDICSIVGNMLDNAIEACERITYDKRFLSISIVAKKKMLLVTVRNSAANIKTIGGRFVTSKNGPHHGLGIQLIDDLVGKYQGYSRREYSEGVFLTQVILPI